MALQLAGRERQRSILTSGVSARTGKRGEQVALGVELTRKDLLALLGREPGKRRRNRALADATLAGDEEQLAIEQIRLTQLTQLTQRANPTLRSSLGAPTST